MTDLRLHLTAQGADLAIENGDLALDHGIQTAVLISLFSDARAEEDQRPSPADSPRGYWGDTAEDRYGSLLWLLRRAKVTQETLTRAEEYARLALSWLIGDGVVERVDVVASLVRADWIRIQVTLTRGQARRFPEIFIRSNAGYYSAGNVELQLLTV